MSKTNGSALAGAFDGRLATADINARSLVALACGVWADVAKVTIEKSKQVNSLNMASLGERGLRTIVC
jgi:hypothetical protein